jgi:xylan 1,4-beta-xylosidase
VLAHVGAEGVLPAVFEPENPGHASRILPAAEGLIYPLLWDDEAAVRGRMAEALRRHVFALLRDPQHRNLFADSGIKLSSTSNNSWMSKIALFQHVCREVFDTDEDDALKELFATADAAHVRWQTDGSGYWACSDQIVSGVAKGSRYYPRVITTALWLTEAASGFSLAPAGKRLLAKGATGAR